MKLKKYNWFKGDILDISCLQDIMTQCTQVYHCAGMVSFNPARVEQMMKINAEGTANVVNISLESGIKKLVHVSSVAALGKKRNKATINEQVKWDEEANLTAYGNSKYQAEMEVWRGISEGLDAVIINPSIILGVGDWHKGSAAMFKNAYREFPWYTEGTSGYVDAMDVAKIMIRLMDSEISAERFIISAENRSYKDIFTQMALAFGKKPPHKKATPFFKRHGMEIGKNKILLFVCRPAPHPETAETAQSMLLLITARF